MNKSLLVLIISLSIVLVHSNTGKGQCGLDIHIMNDNSGSVNSIENLQSRQFITELGNELAPLGTSNNESRISISTWANRDNWIQFNYPIAGRNYTTNFSDVLSYQSAVRPFRGGTDPYRALLKGYNILSQSPIAGRSAPKVLVLMTDAGCSQIPASISSLATTIKSENIYVIVLAIGAAASCTALQNTHVASPGGYFSAVDYDGLKANAKTQILSILSNACGNAAPPSWDLSINITTFTATGCNTGSGTYNANYTVTNNSYDSAFNDNLRISFYDNDPRFPEANLLTVENRGLQNIPAGGSYTAQLSGVILKNTTRLYAVVNYDGNTGNNSPPLPQVLGTKTYIDGEESTTNNISGISRMDGFGCTQQAKLSVNAVNKGIGCNGITTYEVAICNNGDAVGIIDNLVPFAGSGFNLINTTGCLGLDINKIVAAQQKISDTEGNFSGTLDNNDLFGESVARIGDLDRDGIEDIAVGAPNDDDGGENKGAVWILFLNANGTVKNHQKISNTQGGFTGILDNKDFFGFGIASIGDLDRDGTPDIAVGAVGDDDGYNDYFDQNRGAVWILFLNTNGTVKSHQKISNTAGGFTGTINGYQYSDRFGSEIANIGDLDQDGVEDIAVSAPSVDLSQGAVWVLFLNTDGTVKSHSLISSAPTWGLLDDNDHFGYGLAGIGDLDGDGIPDMAVGAYGDDDGYINDNQKGSGAIWILFLNTDGTLKSHQKISNTTGNLMATLGDSDWFGRSVTSIGDWDRDNVVDIAVGAIGGDETIWILCLNTDGTVKNYQKISGTEGGFIGTPQGSFGNSITSIGDFYGDGEEDIVVAAYNTNDGGSQRGAVWVLDLKTNKCKVQPQECTNYTYTYDISGATPSSHNFSIGLEALKDLTTHGVPAVLPDVNFSAGGNAGLSGFNGTQHTSDNITIPNFIPSCPFGDQLSVNVVMSSTGNCGNQAYGTALVTINNQSGLSVSIADLQLQVVGTSGFNSEPYNLTNGLVLAQPNILDFNYPNVNNAFFSKNSSTIRIYTLPAGITSFSIDVLLGFTTATVSAGILNLPTTINNTGQALGSGSISVIGSPSISGFVAPASIVVGNDIILNNISTSGASTVQWTSNTMGNITNNGTVSAPSLSYTPNNDDIANGYIDIQLEALSASNCDATAFARILIIGIEYDFGDAPASYDLDATSLPIAAAAILNPDIFLGNDTIPDAEFIPQHGLEADNDGTDEDAILSPNFGFTPDNAIYTLEVSATNNSLTDAQVVGWIDWNADGDFLDSLERSLPINNSFANSNLPAQSGTTTVSLSWNIPPNVTEDFTSYLRLRVSDSPQFLAQNSPKPYGSAASGEVEDYKITLSSVIKLRLQAFLGGPYNYTTKQMDQNLRIRGFIPINEPYSNLPGKFTHIGSGGGEIVSNPATVFGVTGPDGIVDWVFVELRDPIDSTIVVDTRSGLLQSDGDVVDVDGTSSLLFSVAKPGNYYVTIRHRNHLGAMSNRPILLGGTPTTVDFRNPSALYGIETWGTLAQQIIDTTTNYFGLWPGDANLNSEVKTEGGSNDKNIISTTIINNPNNTSYALNFIIPGYNHGDVDLSGDVTFEGGNNDKDRLSSIIILHPLNITYASNYFFDEQIPK